MAKSDDEIPQGDDESCCDLIISAVPCRPNKQNAFHFTFKNKERPTKINSTSGEMLEKRPNQISFKFKKTKNKLISLSKLTNSQRRYIYFQTKKKKKKNLFKRYGQITTSQHVVRSFAHGTHTCIYIYREKKSEGMKTNSLERKRRRRRKLVVVESTGRS